MEKNVNFYLKKRVEFVVGHIYNDRLLEMFTQ